MTTLDVITLARKNVANNPATEESARICLTDAITLYDDGNYDSARVRARKSLAYSVSIFHDDYKNAVV